jgi:hypothetical protein
VSKCVAQVWTADGKSHTCGQTLTGQATKSGQPLCYWHDKVVAIEGVTPFESECAEEHTFCITDRRDGAVLWIEGGVVDEAPPVALAS